MSEALPSVKEPRRIPWWIWVGLVPAVLIGLNQVRKGGRQRVELAGAGPVALLTSDDAPQDLRYYPDTLPHATLSQARELIIEGLLIQPAVFVFSLDLEAWDRSETSQQELQRLYRELHRRGENAATVPVSIGPWVPAGAAPELLAAVQQTHAWWRQGPCQKAKRLLCIDLADATDEAQMKAQLQAGIRNAVGRLKALRATTQRGR